MVSVSSPPAPAPLLAPRRSSRRTNAAFAASTSARHHIPELSLTTPRPQFRAGLPQHDERAGGAAGGRRPGARRGRVRHRRLPAQDEHARPGPAGQGRHASPSAAPRVITPSSHPLNHRAPRAVRLQLRHTHLLTRSPPPHPQTRPTSSTRSSASSRRTPSSSSSSRRARATGCSSTSRCTSPSASRSSRSARRRSTR